MRRAMRSCRYGRNPLARFPYGDPSIVIRDVLAQAIFRHADSTVAAPPQKSLLDVLSGWIFDHIIEPLLAPIGRALGAGRELGTMIGVVTIAIVALGLVYLAYRFAMRLGRRAPARDAVRETPLGADRSAADWVAFARALAARGDFAGAIAALFSAALATLDVADIVRYDASRTPGEYRRAVRRERTPAASSFDDLAAGFMRASYAAEPPDAGDYAAVAAAFDRFEPALRA